MTETTEFTKEDVQAKARELVQLASHQQANAGGQLLIKYPGAIPDLDRAAVEALQADGIGVNASKWAESFGNLISFPAADLARVSV